MNTSVIIGILFSLIFWGGIIYLIVKFIRKKFGKSSPSFYKIYNQNGLQFVKKLEELEDKELLKNKKVRCLMYYKDKEVYTSSRGGKDYDTPTTYIRKNTFLNQFFNNNPNVVLDGELYIHGKPLSYISGIVRLQDLCEKHEELQYYVYDIVDETKTFQERLKILTELDKCMSLSSIIPNRVVVVNHESVSGKDAIVQLHNQYISEGYEGLVIRDPNEKYKCGARDKRMLKVKMFQDDEFEITGMTDGLREEDFVFNMKTKDGYPFEAKPMGDRALKK